MPAKSVLQRPLVCKAMKVEMPKTMSDSRGSDAGETVPWTGYSPSSQTKVVPPGPKLRQYSEKFFVFIFYSTELSAITFLG